MTEFEASLGKEHLRVRQLSKQLSTFYRRELRKRLNRAYTGEDIQFLVAGYDEGSPYGKVFRISIPKELSQPEEQIKKEVGFIFGGDTVIVKKLLVDTPYDLKELGISGCLDLAIAMIEITAHVQRLTLYKDTVGGTINVTTIGPSGKLDNEKVLTMSRNRAYP